MHCVTIDELHKKIPYYKYDYNFCPQRHHFMYRKPRHLFSSFLAFWSPLDFKICHSKPSLPFGVACRRGFELGSGAIVQAYELRKGCQIFGKMFVF